MRRFLAYSAEEYQDIQHGHHHGDEAFRFSDIMINAGVRIENDPLQMPQCFVDTKMCRDRVQTMVDGKVYNVACKSATDGPDLVPEYDEMIEELNKLDIGADAEKCLKCKQYMRAQADIGVISACSKDASVEEKAAEALKRNRRTAA